MPSWPAIGFAFAGGLLLAVSSPAISDQAKKANITILATGGTIAGAGAAGAEPVYTSGAVTIDTMMAAAPGIGELATVRGEQISNIGSQDMSFEIMLRLAKRINKLARDRNVDGFVITHGTDTMEETAFFLNLTAKTNKPVVMVGAMRPSTAVGADGPRNLYDAVAVAADPNSKGRGVLVVMNGQIHAAHSLTKMSTLALDSFMSPLRGAVGVSNDGRNRYNRTTPFKHTTRSEFDITNVTKLPRVDVIFADADMSPDIIDASVANGAKGIVVAGVGNGNMNTASVEAAARAAREGIRIVRSSRVPAGVTGPNAEIDDNKLGFVASYELNPQKARILLSLALLKPRGAKAIQKLFYTY